MSISWIKMRTDLLTHPKVVRMMSALRADKFRVIGGLHSVWCVFDAHSEDGTLPGYTFEAMDAVIGWPGFSEQMAAIQWLTLEGEDTLIAPRFDEHNGQSAKRRASDAKRKADARADDPEYGGSRKGVRNLSASGADKKQTREEKRREETNTEESKDSSPGAFELPEWVDAAAWALDDAMRQRIETKRKPWDDDVRRSAVATLARLKAQGNEPAAVLEQSALSSWQGLFAVRGSERGTPKAPAGAGSKHGGFGQKDYRAGIGDDGSFH